MVPDVKQLICKNTWKHMSRDKVPTDKNGNKQTIFEVTWVFKIKHIDPRTTSSHHSSLKLHSIITNTLLVDINTKDIKVEETIPC